MKMIAFLVAVLIVVLLVYALVSGKKEDEDNGIDQASSALPFVPSPTVSGGLVIEDAKVGVGKEAQVGDMVAVHYTGTLKNGTKFDSSYDRGEPLRFPLGSGMVIQGWDLGVVGMREGGKRLLVIPPELAYGATSPSPAIPPNSTLLFEVELVDIEGK